jgi:hypothetical protein
MVDDIHVERLSQFQIEFCIPARWGNKVDVVQILELGNTPPYKISVENMLWWNF